MAFQHIEFSKNANITNDTIEKQLVGATLTSLFYGNMMKQLKAIYVRSVGSSSNYDIK